MRSPSVLLVALITLLAGLTGCTYAAQTQSEPPVVRDASSSALIYGGVGSPAELESKLRTGTYNFGGNREQTAADVRNAFHIDEGYVPNAADALPGLGTINADGSLYYRGQTIGRMAFDYVISGTGDQTNQQFTKRSLHDQLDRYDLSSQAVLIYRLAPTASPSDLAASLSTSPILVTSPSFPLNLGTSPLSAQPTYAIVFTGGGEQTLAFG